MAAFSPPLAPRVAALLIALIAHGLFFASLVRYQPARAERAPEAAIMVSLIDAPRPVAPEPKAIVPPPTPPAPKPEPRVHKPVPPKPRAKPIARKPKPVQARPTPAPKPTVLATREREPVHPAPPPPPAPDAIEPEPAKAEAEAAQPAPPPPAPERMAVAVPPAPVIAPRFNADYLQNPPPRYPRLSRRLGEEGTVLLRVFVDEKGMPARVQVKSSSGYERLDRAAAATVKEWKFVPARRGSDAIGAWVLVPVSFELRS